MVASRNYLNRRRWAIDQQKKARAIHAETAFARHREEEAARLASLRQLAGMLQGQPHMESTLVAVQTEIARLEGRDPQ